MWDWDFKKTKNCISEKNLDLSPVMYSLKSLFKCQYWYVICRAAGDWVRCWVQVQVTLFVPVGKFLAQLKSAGHPWHSFRPHRQQTMGQYITLQWDKQKKHTVYFAFLPISPLWIGRSSSWGRSSSRGRSSWGRSSWGRSSWGRSSWGRRSWGHRSWSWEKNTAALSQFIK